MNRAAEPGNPHPFKCGFGSSLNFRIQTDLERQEKMAEAGWIKPPRRGRQGSAVQGRHQANNLRRPGTPPLNIGHNLRREKSHDNEQRRLYRVGRYGKTHGGQSAIERFQGRELCP